MYKIIAVYKTNPVTARCIYSRITCRRYPCVFLMYDLYPAVSLCKMVAENGAVVGASVVNKYQLEIGKCLGEDAFYAPREVFSGIGCSVLRLNVIC